MTEINDFLDIKKASSDNTPNIEDLFNPAVVYQRIKNLHGITTSLVYSRRSILEVYEWEIFETVF
ncbi:MAG: hypothetical protein V3V22_03940 [Methylococcales bacterium]